MRKLTPVVLRPWTLPLIVLAVIVPITASVLLAGPAAGFAAGAAVATVIVVIAARTRYDEPIEVASASDRRYHVVVVTEPAADPGTVETIAAAAREGARAGRSDRDAEVLVLAPALNRPLSHWLSDLRDARLEAQERLAVSVAALATAHVEATGRVGDTDPVQAVEDTLASFPAQEVVFVTGQGTEGAVSEIRRRLDRPLHHVVVDQATVARAHAKR
jgi:hypothetical protein